MIFSYRNKDRVVNKERNLNKAIMYVKYRVFNIKFNAINYEKLLTTLDKCSLYNSCWYTLIVSADKTVINRKAYYIVLIDSRRRDSMMTTLDILAFCHEYSINFTFSYDNVYF